MINCVDCGNEITSESPVICKAKLPVKIANAMPGVPQEINLYLCRFCAVCLDKEQPLVWLTCAIEVLTGHEGITVEFAN